MVLIPSMIMARLSGSSYRRETPKDFPTLLHKPPRRARVLIALEAPAGVADDPLRWAEHVEELDRLWLRPALRALRAGKLRRLRLWPCDGRGYQLSRARAWLAALRRGSMCSTR